MRGLTHRYHQLTTELAQHPGVQLLAVSKGQPLQKVREAYQLGQRHFGENYLQEAEQKIAQCTDLPDIQWHYIGPLQRNKTRAVAELFDWVHSVDRALLAERLGRQRPDSMPPLNVLIQLNVDDEAQKSGAHPDALDELAQTIGTYASLRLRGIMGIPKHPQSADGLRASFAALQQAYQRCRTLAEGVDTLSMGMSGDWPLAVQTGATMVRIGTALFGPRE